VASSAGRHRDTVEIADPGCGGREAKSDHGLAERGHQSQRRCHPRPREQEVGYPGRIDALPVEACCGDRAKLLEVRVVRRPEFEPADRA
jgi:hypothetical protein